MSAQRKLFAGLPGALLFWADWSCYGYSASPRGSSLHAKQALYRCPAQKFTLARNQDLTPPRDESAGDKESQQLKSQERVLRTNEGWAQS